MARFVANDRCNLQKKSETGLFPKPQSNILSSLLSEQRDLTFLARNKYQILETDDVGDFMCVRGLMKDIET